jgi:hypothetical protein
MNTISNAAGPGWAAGSFHGTAAQAGGMPGRISGATRHPAIGALVAVATIASLVAVCAATMPAGTGSTAEMVEAAQEWQYLGAVRESGHGAARRPGLALDLAESNAGEGAAMFYASGEGTALHHAAGEGDAGEGAALRYAAGEGDAGEGTALHYAAGEGIVLQG